MLRQILRRTSSCADEALCTGILKLSTSESTKKRRSLPEGPDLRSFLRNSNQIPSLLNKDDLDNRDASLKVYLETYGCQMNVSDSEVVLSILSAHGYAQTHDASIADLLLLNTCAIRDKPERKIWSRLQQLRQTQKQKSTIGVLGCMAERLKEKLLDIDRLADLVVGPDAYRELPQLLQKLKAVSTQDTDAVNVVLSLEETYADILPLRQTGKVNAYLSIMRGCNNMCAFCIVPFTRGRERSRPLRSILDEVRYLRDQGVKEITLLGQNVNSYHDFSNSKLRQNAEGDPFSVYADGFSSVYKPKREGAVSFAELLHRVASIDEEVRIRFTSPHPKDFSDDVIDVVRENHNVCKHLHVPAQSGNSNVLHRMKRGYNREAYDALIDRIQTAIPNVSLSTDIIVGFCGETEQEHEDTLDLLRRTSFNQAFLFKYSEREKTFAHRHLNDNVPESVKQRRLEQVIEVYREQLYLKNCQDVDRLHLVLVEEMAKKMPNCLTGRTDTFKRVIFPVQELDDETTNSVKRTPAVGDYVVVRINAVTHGTFWATPLSISSIRAYTQRHLNKDNPNKSIL